MRVRSRTVALRVAISVAVFVSGVMFSGCSAGPAEVLSAMSKAATAGDDEAFACYFTQGSKPFVEALLSLQKARYPAIGDSPRPIQLIVDSRVIDERVDGDRAVLRVQSAGQKFLLVFIKEGGDWRLDVHQTDLENAREP